MNIYRYIIASIYAIITDHYTCINSRCMIGIFMVLFMLPYNIQEGQDPRSIVEKFCKADSEGARLGWRASSSIDSLLAWGDEIGWEGYAVIAGYSISCVSIDGDSASVKVKYDVLGVKIVTNWIEADSTYYDKDAWDDIKTVNYRLILSQEGWKIVGPVMTMPHVYRRP